MNHLCDTCANAQNGQKCNLPLSRVIIRVRGKDKTVDACANYTPPNKKEVR